MLFATAALCSFSLSSDEICAVISVGNEEIDLLNEVYSAVSDIERVQFVGILSTADVRFDRMRNLPPAVRDRIHNEGPIVLTKAQAASVIGKDKHTHGDMVVMPTDGYLTWTAVEDESDVTYTTAPVSLGFLQENL